MWLETIIKTNLMKLALLLKYAPNSEVLPMTTELWIDAFNSALGRNDESLDAARVDKAFMLARERFVDWPAPAQIIELMPRRPEVRRLDYEPRHHEPKGEHLAIKDSGSLSEMLDALLTTTEPDEEMPF